MLLPSPSRKNFQRSKHDIDIEPEASVLDVVEVIASFIIEANAISPMDLRVAGDSRFDTEESFVSWLV